jgi:Sulfatase
LKLWLNSLLRLLAGAYFVLTSLYCLLAFLPYTYFFLIKAPAYAWMPWFVRHQAILYWLAAAATVTANWRLREVGPRREQKFLAGVLLLIGIGIYLSFHPFLTTLEDNRSAYGWGLAALLPIVAISFWRGTAPAVEITKPDGHFVSYPAGFLIALAVCATYGISARLRVSTETHPPGLHGNDAALAVWSIISHLTLAVAVVSILNLIAVLAATTANPRLFRRTGIGAAVFGSTWFALQRFLENALSFGGWEAQLYAASLSLALTFWSFSVVLPLVDALQPNEKVQPHRITGRKVAWTILFAAIALAIAFPHLIGGEDWSGFFESTVTLLVWIAISVSLFHLWPRRAQHSVVMLFLVLAGSAAAYKTLQASEIFWSRPLGATDDEIALALEAYGGHDTSFQLVHHILGNSRNEACGDLCRILREYTNIRDTQARVDVQLVDKLTPATGARPNIFLFVIDSMRPDYLGIYNPRVDYTPNLDSFARDSIVFHHAYSQYAGTSLSEPAIWAGAMMLHAHYLQPFARLNSLDRMLHVDGYRMIVSMDEVLSAVLPADDGIAKLDTDKKLWNEFELGSTLRQARPVLDSSSQPVFLYAQPKNVHQFARNDVPSPTSQHWQSTPGLSPRITYEVHWVDSCLGDFFSYLKQRGMYDDSIIIVTSDHGDATGELGRISHSTLIWPEVMHVPLIIHLPQKMRENLVFDDSRLSTLTDLAPSLYYLLGHRPIRQNPLYGRPLFAETREELGRYPGKDLLLASDVRAVYGILTADGRYLYTTYDSPAQSYLFDLNADPDAQHNILTPTYKRQYDEEIIDELHRIGDFYHYRPGVESLLASAGK